MYFRFLSLPCVQLVVDATAPPGNTNQTKTTGEAPYNGGNSPVHEPVLYPEHPNPPQKTTPRL